MKKAALRRVIIYVLVFSLTFTSVSAAIVRPVEVQASAGVMEGWEVFVGILSSLGFFSSSSTAGQTYYDQFMNWVNETSSFDSQVYSMFSNLSSDLVSNGVEQVTANKMQVVLCNSIIKLFDRDILLSSSDVSGSFSFPSAEVTYELSDDHLRMVETYTDCKYGIVLECDVNKFIQNRKLSFNLNSEITIIDKEASDAAIQTYTLNLVNFLKKMVANWINTQSKQYAKNKAMVNNSKVSSIKSADETNSVRDNVMLYLTDINSKYFSSSSTNDFYHTPLVLKKYLVTNNINFTDIYNEQSLVFPSSFISIYYFRTVSSYTPGFLELYFTEDLSGYDLVMDNNKLYKFDSDDNSSLVLYGKFARADVDSVSLSTDLGFNLSDSIYRNGFSDYKLMSYSDGASEWRSFQLSGIDLSKYYTSLDNYINHVSYYDEAKQYIFYGSSDYAASDNSDVYVPDGTTYDKLVEDIEANAANAEKLAAALAAAQAANAKALEDMKDSIEEGNATTASLLQKILDAVLALPTSIISNVSVDVTAIKSLISNLDTSISDSLPIIQDVADNGALTVEKVNELVDALNGALEKNGVIGGVNERVDDIAEDSAAIAGAISSAIAGDKSISVSITPEQQVPEEQDNFNLGFFNILYLLFLILFKIIMIFCHCLELLFTIHSVKAYPYFINNDMIRGLNWIKSVNITGGLLNISLYDFLFALVRIILVFSVIRLIRHYTDRL